MWMRLGSVLEPSWASWRRLGPSWVRFGLSEKCLEAILETLWPPWSLLITKSDKNGSHHPNEFSPLNLRLSLWEDNGRATGLRWFRDFLYLLFLPLHPPQVFGPSQSSALRASCCPFSVRWEGQWSSAARKELK